MTGKVARLTFKPTGPHLVEVLDDGRQVAEAPVSELVPGTAGWDRKLVDLGYVRLGAWRPETDGRWQCQVSGRSEG